MRKFSVIIPAYNEENNISSVVETVINGLNKYKLFEIVLVDDGSADKTYERMLAIQKAYPNINIRVSRHSTNKGRLATRLTGIKMAKFDRLIFIDSKCRLIKLDDRIINSSDTFVGQALLGNAGLMPVTLDVIRRIYYGQKFFNNFVDLKITDENFNKIPKGTGALVVDKQSLQKIYSRVGTDKTGSDDTKLLKALMTITPLFKTSDYAIAYINRVEIFSNMNHLFQRGPKYVDYYIKKRLLKFTILLLVSLCLLGLILIPISLLYILPLLLMLHLIGSSIVSFAVRLNFIEFLYFLVGFPLVVLSFLSGIIYGSAIKLFK